MQNSQPSERKLKILCLHGYNMNNETFIYFSQGFRNTFHHVADFEIFEGIFDVTSEPPDRLSQKRGIKGPLKTYFDLPFGFEGATLP